MRPGRDKLRSFRFSFPLSAFLSSTGRQTDMKWAIQRKERRKGAIVALVVTSLDSSSHHLLRAVPAEQHTAHALDDTVYDYRGVISTDLTADTVLCSWEYATGRCPFQSIRTTYRSGN